MLEKTFYHGSPVYEEILRRGFDHDAPRRCDPGDFGWGVYLTAQLARAKCHGPVLEVRVETSRLAFIRNPYFLKDLQSFPPETPEEKLFHELVFGDRGEMRTVKTFPGETPTRDAVCREVQRVFLLEGYSGITTGMDDQETVLFDLSAVLLVSNLQKVTRTSRAP